VSTTAIDDRIEERQPPRRRALNFWIDLATTVLFAALLGTGGLMNWVLPPGTCDAPKLMLWLGHARHWWGDIHFIIALSLLALVLVHLYLHWKWVTGVWGRLIGSARAPQTWALGAVMAALLAMPFCIPRQVLDVPPAAGAVVTNASQSSPTLAPCGVPGLSCENCPAAGDRLLGAAEKKATAKDATAAKDTQSPCDTCPSAGGDGNKNGCAECPNS
jgi:hypothetical protein